jgi:hypothetical protein
MQSKLLLGNQTSFLGLQMYSLGRFRTWHNIVLQDFVFATTVKLPVSVLVLVDIFLPV